LRKISYQSGIHKEPFFFVCRLRRFPQIVLFLICENPCHLRIDLRNRIIFPAYSIRTSVVPLVAASECESTQIDHNRFAIIDSSWSIYLYLQPFAFICGQIFREI